MFNWFFRSETEKRRDDYWALYEKLKTAIDTHDRRVTEAEASYSSYKRSIPFLLTFRIPSNDFEPKRQELTGEVKELLEYEKDKRSDLVRAKNNAYDRYLYYKQQAIKEAENN
ncbi:hypothetical protein SAMN05421736_11520 [Evansella caseinilytica]|uniref:Uncharacterized protein n=1 Tax=Evansella caseinilytica TaxID=1503961 RepID=A0A1H3TK49_9BACI|nr:hypothetical protein [Evansella caseinilytica]SDZ50490.1 hypothetical protein SAMN05421736_11520 [Evansella caseinilytica]